MRHELPSPIRNRLLPALAALLMIAAPLARAFEFAAATPSRDEQGRVWVTVRLTDPLEERVERSLRRGMPATLALHAELWRKRSGWFDRMEHAFDANLRLRYDVGEDAWTLQRGTGGALVVRSLDSLETALSGPIALPLAKLSASQAQSRYFVVVTGTVQPLNVEDVAEVEGWISGEVRAPRSSGLGVLTQLPSSVFDAVRNFAGFGDSRTRLLTPEFVPAVLPARR
ncbi:MAG: DUF4390 domain-containing protein [Candidatus Eisenbacteria bacterium]|uniref:DUF4390 domain-containing protein n=1 Tax=Eiseniibacteriota bacterium TaxID=2212470 RepID=A0A933W3E2_UNCEI|nr:DUF4390 domain-containing protein [Candidatus Eisenbacteria bacterium]